MTRGVLQPVLAGLVSAVVGYASAFTIVLAGLRAVGATPRQAASGLLAVCIGIAIAAIFLALRYRMPIAIAWSTPGAALLVASGSSMAGSGTGDSAISGGFRVAVGAFLVSAALTVLAGVVPWFARLVAAIPRPIAGAMLAGVILPLCTAPVHALIDVPLLAVPVTLTWAVLFRFARPWAVPGALAAAVVAIAVQGTKGLSAASLRPALEFTAPAFTVPAIIGLAVPLFLVTMAGQNVPGAAVLSTFGYDPPLRGALITTGLVSAAAAPFGGHAVNLAAITAALTAGPDTHRDPGRRWIATVALGCGQLALGLAAGLATALVTLSPPVLVTAVAGLALLPALASALTNALADTERREAAVITFVVTAAGLSIVGVGSAFWGLLAGLAALFLKPWGTRTQPVSDTAATPEAQAPEPIAQAPEPIAQAAAPVGFPR